MGDIGSDGFLERRETGMEPDRPDDGDDQFGVRRPRKRKSTTSKIDRGSSEVFIISADGGGGVRHYLGEAERKEKDTKGEDAAGKDPTGKESRSKDRKDKDSKGKDRKGESDTDKEEDSEEDEAESSQRGKGAGIHYSLDTTRGKSWAPTGTRDERQYREYRSSRMIGSIAMKRGAKCGARRRKRSQ